ncbi:hypothetical protein [Absidia glauca]|uniref:ADF-H domain-containing protein n=1 Tax=Absidia glauca TaxID=4829 RepID=A0A163JYI5_ABSGL|nr:hypothetical protein [Absidia glauca]
MCDLSDPRITQTYQAIIEGEPTDWLLLGYNDTRDVISLYSSGTSGLNEFRNQLKDEILFGFVRVEDRFILISYVPDQVSGVRRARTLVHSRSVASLFQVHHAQLTASSLNDLSDANIRTRLKLGENQVPNRSRPNSLSERKRSSLQARRKSQQQQPPPSDRPSLPSSPTTSSYTTEPDTFEEAQEDFSTPPLDTTPSVTPNLSTPTPASLSSATPTSTSTLDANDYHQSDDHHSDDQQDSNEQQHLDEQRRLDEQHRLEQEQQQRLAEQQRIAEEQQQRRAEEQRAADQRAAEQRAAEQQRLAQEEEAKIQRQKEEAERLAKEKEEERRLQIEKDRQEKQRILQKQLQQAEKTKDVIIQGFSNVQTNGSPFWRRRFFAVRGKNLAFYRDHDAATPVTIIDLKSISNLRWTDMEIDTFVPNAFMIEMSDGAGYQIFADHQQDAQTIFTALQTIIQSK